MHIMEAFIRVSEMALVGITLPSIAVRIVYSWLETFADGNYNLHFLSLEMRRALRLTSHHDFSGKFDSPSRRSDGKSYFCAETSLLVYICLLWDFSGQTIWFGMRTLGYLWRSLSHGSNRYKVLSRMVPHLTACQHFSGVELSSRIKSISLAITPFLESTLNLACIVGTWVITSVMSETFDSSTSGRSVIDGDLVYLRSYTSGGYLQAEADIQSIIDHESGILLNPDETHQNFRVGCVLPTRSLRSALSDEELLSVFPEIRNSSTWNLFYNRKSGDGSQLYSPIVGCFLSSTFRSFPDYNGERVIDTLIHQLRLKLDTTCSTNPNHAASTSFVIDGRHIFAVHLGDISPVF